MALIFKRTSNLSCAAYQFNINQLAPLCLLDGRQGGGYPFGADPHGQSVLADRVS